MVRRYLAAIWNCRYFWMSLVKMDLRTRYRRSALGVGWSLLQPVLMTLVLCTVFHGIFNLDPYEYAPSLLIGLCFWNYLSSVALQGCNCLFQGEKYIRQHPAPIAIYPLRTTLGSSVHFGIALSVAVLLVWVMHGFGNVPALLSLIPSLLLLFVLGWAVAILTGFATAYFPDVQHLTEVALQLMFYATPIIYPAQVLKEKGLGWIAAYNPLAAYVALLRQPILEGVSPEPALFLTAGLTTLVVAGAASLMLARCEQRIIFQL